jgi:uncharacterized membrane protein YkvA (DUF1232 family)
MAPKSSYAGTMAFLERIKGWARRIKRDIATLWLAARHPDVPWHAKAVAAATVAYALSPIDLIPDFVPVLGYLDDLVIVPAGILLAVRLIPAATLAELRRQADAAGRLPASRTGLVFIVLLWLLAAAALALWLFGGR